MASISDFVQQVPREGAPATERTESWVLFDRDTLYISARCWDTAPPEQWVANELRRDTNQLRQNDTFGVILDTFYDRRNGFLFYTNPLGARADQAVTDEGNLNPDWNPVWDVRTGRFDGGWTVEMAIPFKSLRYRSGANQVWGINIRRVIRRKNEWTHLTLVPAAAGVPGGMFRLSRAGTLVGLDLPPASRNIELKPYAISRLTTDRRPDAGAEQRPRRRRRARRQVRRHREPDGRRDRQHRLRAGRSRRAAGQPDAVQPAVSREARLLPRGPRHLRLRAQRHATSSTTLTPTLFYSRRIGLNGGRVVPIDVGGRLTGKVGPFSVGAMNIETRDDDAATANDAAHQLHGRPRSSATSCGAAPSAPSSRIGPSRRSSPAPRTWSTARMRRSRSSRTSTLGGYYARSNTDGVTRGQRQLSGAVRRTPAIATARRRST